MASNRARRGEDSADATAPVAEQLSLLGVEVDTARDYLNCDDSGLASQLVEFAGAIQRAHTEHSRLSYTVPKDEREDEDPEEEGILLVVMGMMAAFRLPHFGSARIACSYLYTAAYSGDWVNDAHITVVRLPDEASDVQFVIRGSGLTAWEFRIKGRELTAANRLDA